MYSLVTYNHARFLLRPAKSRSGRIETDSAGFNHKDSPDSITAPGNIRVLPGEIRFKKPYLFDLS